MISKYIYFTTILCQYVKKGYKIYPLNTNFFWETTIMPNYQKMYLIAVSAMADALDELDKLNIGAAKEFLKEALYHAEEVYITQGEDDSDTSSDTSDGSEPSEPPVE